MAKPLSPAAAAVLRAAGDSEPGIYATIAAALRAAADQVVPEQGCPIYGLTERENERQQVRSQLLAIAAELEGIKYGTYRCALPKPVAPTTAELMQLSAVCNSLSVFARAVLARWGSHS
jgi:hypothetical protein